MEDEDNEEDVVHYDIDDDEEMLIGDLPEFPVFNNFIIGKEAYAVIHLGSENSS